MAGFVLIVEDEPILGRNMRIFLERQGFTARHVTTMEDGLAAWKSDHPDLVLVDHNLPDGTGLMLIEAIREVDRLTRLVMVTAHGGVDLAVMAMKSGANDYLTKPVSLDELGLLATRLLREARVEGELAVRRRRDRDASGLDLIVGQSPAIQELKRKIKFITQAENEGSPNEPGPPVLILGETGTGKELVARAIHFEGPRRAGPFISVNCAALPEQLIEAELFGHERGAFTGATDKNIGLFQAADGGTLFLDEIGELPLGQQGKLLKALEDRRIRSVGSTRDRPVNIRLVAATNIDIEHQVAQGSFRSDLLYRINTLTLDLPPLRARGGDALLIAEGLLDTFARRYGRAYLGMDASARESVLGYAWPGNVRELRNVMERAALLAAGKDVTAADLGLRGVPAPQISPGGDRIADQELKLIVTALRDTRGNVSSAAKLLGISRDTLRYRMDKFGLSRGGF